MVNTTAGQHLISKIEVENEVKEKHICDFVWDTYSLNEETAEIDKNICQKVDAKNNLQI